MPKDRKKSNSPSCERIRLSPYDCNSNKKKKKDSGERGNNRVKRYNLYKKEKDQWEELRCPICMDHPHKAVLLICSSHEKGCRPYLCDTSHLLSNCFDLFCELYSVTPSKSTDPDHHQPNKFVGCGESGRAFVCPLCRGQIRGWIVVQGAREFMNKILRGCAMDSCDFSGNYVELKKHAKLEHPTVRPSQVNSEQHQNWRDEVDEVDELDENDYNSDDEELDGGDEVNSIPLRPGDSFFNHIDFGPEEETLREEYSVSNGILHYTRTTTSGRTYEYATLLGES